MKCWIYRGALRAETYLYLPEQDRLEQVPAELLRRLGQLELVMELELSPGRSLARANPAEVMQSLRSRGFYLQLPPPRIPGADRVQ